MLYIVLNAKLLVGSLLAFVLTCIIFQGAPGRVARKRAASKAAGGVEDDDE